MQMLNPELIKSKILFDLIPTFTKSLHYSKTMPDVQICTRLALSEIDYHVFPKETTAAVDIQMQHAEDDKLNERKDVVFDLVRDVAAACNEFIKDQIDTEADLEKEARDLAEEKLALQVLINRPGRVKLGGDAGYQNLIDKITER